LIEGQETQMLPQFLPGAEYLETLDIEVLRSPLRVDRVYRVLYRKQKHILHLEFETASDKKMSYRLLEYHAYFFRKYEIPVLSIIVYPFPTTVVESPLVEMSDRETVLTFHFRTLRLWTLSAEEFMQKRIVGMYALLPTMDGVSEHLLFTAIDEILEEYRNDNRRLTQELLWFSILLGRANQIDPAAKQRVERKLSMWDNLIEQDPKIQRWLATSEEKGLEKGLIQGEEKAIAALQDSILNDVEKRFPALAQGVKPDIARITQVKSLFQLTVEITLAQDEAAVLRAIQAYLP
jgi:hypothetical protein